MKPRMTKLLPHLATSTLRATLAALDAASDAVRPLRRAILVELRARELEEIDIAVEARERIAGKLADAELEAEALLRRWS